METLRDAARLGRCDVLEEVSASLVLECINPETANNPLHIAAKHGSDRFLSDLLTRFPSDDARIDAALLRDQHGFTCMHLAAANGHPQVVQVLMEFDPNLCRKRDHRNGWTALHQATSASKIEVINGILGGDPQSIEDLTNRQETCLHIAVKYKHFDAFRLLLNWIQARMIDANGRNIINQKDKEGNTILHIAASMRMVQFADSLLMNNDNHQLVEVNIKNGLGLRPLNYCYRGTKDSVLIETLERAGCRYTESINGFIDYVSHLPEDRRNTVAMLLSTIAYNTLQLGLVGINLGSEIEELGIRHLLLRPGPFFWKYYGLVCLTIVFTMCILGISFLFHDSPTRIFVITIALIALASYFTLMASKLANLIIVYDSYCHIQVNCVVWLGVIYFYVGMVFLYMLIRKLKELMVFLRR